MSDEFGTVNYKRGDRAREIERLREHYLHHRQALVGLMGDAPTEQLEHGYQRMIGDIDAALAKVAELEGRVPAADGGAALAPAALPPVASIPSPRSSTSVPPPPVLPPHPARNGDDFAREKTQPDLTLDTYDPDATQHDYPPPAAGDAEGGSSSRMIMMIGAALVVLGIIGWLIWRAGAERRASDRILEAPVTTTASETTETADAAPAVSTSEPAANASGGLTVSPKSADYGTLRKGTRAVRQFTIRNRGTAPVSVAIARSQCRCLYYEYREKIEPGATETVTVTIDGARAKAGTLQETLKLTSKEDPALAAEFEVKALVQ